MNQTLIDLGLFLAFTIYALGVVYLGTELQQRKKNNGMPKT